MMLDGLLTLHSLNAMVYFYHRIERYAKDGTSQNSSVKNCNGLKIRIQVVAKDKSKTI